MSKNGSRVSDGGWIVLVGFGSWSGLGGSSGDVGQELDACRRGPRESEDGSGRIRRSS
jgi:hypothetical protein